MNLFYLANIRIPSERAHASQIINMCNAFHASGADVQLVVSNRKSAITDSVEEYYGQKIDFIIKKIKTLDLIHISWVYHFSSIFFALHFLSLVKTKESDLIFSRDELILFVLCFFRNPSSMIWESHQAKYNFISRALVKRGVKLIVISEGIRDFYISKGIKTEKILVAHDAVDESFFGEVLTKTQARKKLNLPENERLAMYIGGFDKWKGIDVFLEASLLLNKYVFAVIGGNDELINIYSKRYPNVIFLGQKPYRELRNNQQATDILVIPNTSKTALSAEYTSPLKLFAHMTSKVPIVASNVPSIRNVLSDSEAFFFQADNPISLSEAINHVFENLDLASDKALSAFNHSKEYTWKIRAKKILNFVQR